jgi:hypothetical protein
MSGYRGQIRLSPLKRSTTPILDIEATGVALDMPTQGYDAGVPSLPTILLVLSFPAGALGYALGVRVMSALPLPDETRSLLVLFVPLFIAGLVMMPFLVPFFDRKAKQDLAEHARSKDRDANGREDSPDR